LAILIVEDSASRTPELAILLTDPTLRQWMKQSAARAYVLDSGAVQASGAPSPLLEPYRKWTAASLSGGSQSEMLPALLLVRSDGSVYQGARLPASSADVRRWIETRTR
jgi:ABC-type branched-subunit amino acid transport system ATPase component